MATVAVLRNRRLTEARPSSALLAALTLVALTLISIYVRTRAISGSFWMDEGLSVGISSHSAHGHPARPAPGRLAAALLHAAARLDGRLRAASETAVHWLSLVASLLTIPAAMWAGWSLFGKRAGYLGAVALRAHPVPHRTTARRRGCTR